MRVGIDLRTLETPTGKRGIGYFTLNMVQELLKIPQADTEYIIYTTFTHRPKLDLKSAQVKYSFFPIPTLYRPRRGLRRFDPLMKLAWKVALKLSRPDLLHLPSLHDIYYLEIPKDIKTIVTIYDLIPLIYPGKFFKDKIASGWYVDRLEQLKKYQSTVITISQASKKDIVRILKLPEGRVRVTYGGLDPRFKPLPKAQVAKVLNRYGIRQPFLLSVGAFSFHKNIVRVFRAIGELREEFPKLKLVVVCKLIAQEKRVWEKQLKALGIEDRVILTNFVKDEELPYFYNGAEALVYPSLYEGFGLPILEAFACLTVVVTSNSSSMPEAGGRAAVYVDPKSVKDMVRGIREIGAVRGKLINRGWQQVKKFSWQKTAQETLKTYRELLKK